MSLERWELVVMRLPALLLVVCLSWSAVAQQPAPAPRPATGPAPSVVFLLDASGSMPDIGLAKQEIERGVAALPEGTRFTIIANNEGGKAVAYSKALVPFKPTLMPAVKAYLGDVTPGGPDGLFAESLVLIAKLKPDVVWFCTDGHWVPVETHLAAVTAAAKRGGYRLNLVLFMPNKEKATEVNGIAEAVRKAGGKVLTEKGEPFQPIVMAAKPVTPKAVKPKADRPSIFQE